MKFLIEEISGLVVKRAVTLENQTFCDHSLITLKLRLVTPQIELSNSYRDTSFPKYEDQIENFNFSIMPELQKFISFVTIAVSD